MHFSSIWSQILLDIIWLQHFQIVKLLIIVKLFFVFDDKIDVVKSVHFILDIKKIDFISEISNRLPKWNLFYFFIKME